VPKPHKRYFQPRTDTEKTPVQQAIPRGGLLDQLQLMQAGLLAPPQGQFLDLTGYDDYQGALDFVVETKRRFEGLPSSLRRACMNDPRQFLKLASEAAQGDDLAIAHFKRAGLTVTAAGRVHSASTPTSQVPRDPDQQDLVEHSKNAGSLPKGDQ